MADENTEQPPPGNGGGPASAPIPPYIPFQTFLTFLKQLKTDGLPPQIDKSVLSKFSGGTQGQLKVALKTLGLMDDNKPTDELEAMVNALETPEFEPLLLKMLQRTYPYVFAIDLKTATPTMFADAFKVTGAQEAVTRKCRTFFLHAAKRAGVSLGNRILTGTVPRTPSIGPKRKPKAAKPKADPPPDQSGNNADTNTTQTGGLVEKLLAKFPEFDPKWPDEIKAKWFAGFDQFMQSTKNSGG